MKKAKKVICFCGLAVLALYIIESVVISVVLRNIIQNSYENYGESNPYKTVVSDEIYTEMCFRNGYLTSSNEFQNTKENKTLLGPISYHWFFGGKATYLYSYEIYNEKGTVVGGSWRVPVTVDYTISGGKLLITDYYEAP